MSIGPVNSSTTTSPPSSSKVVDLIVLGDRHLYVLSLTSGQIIFSSTPYSIPLFMRVYYPVPNELRCHVIMGDIDGLIRVLNGRELLWAAKAPFAPVALHLGIFPNTTKGMLVMLGADGQLSIGYFGTAQEFDALRLTDRQRLDGKRGRKARSGEKQGNENGGGREGGVLAVKAEVKALQYNKLLVSVELTNTGKDHIKNITIVPRVRASGLKCMDEDCMLRLGSLGLFILHY
jgi:hypothetical protein